MFGRVVLGLLYCDVCPWSYCYKDRVSLDVEVTVRDVRMWVSV